TTYFPEVGCSVQRLRQPCGKKKLQICPEQYFAAQSEVDTIHCHPDSKRIIQSSVSEQSYPHKPCMSRVPLRLLIKVSGQRDGLGISIAGGRGSLPYIENDEVFYLPFCFPLFLIL
ncbi:membrane-associated guanylate kinase, WW and PDZ domain-containing protein 3, partial [Tachysurus ichikawai]